MRTSSILLISACVFLLISISCVFIASDGVKIVDCYDENNNKILELNCEENVYPDTYYILLLSGGIGILLSIMGAFVFSSIGD